MQCPLHSITIAIVISFSLTGCGTTNNASGVTTNNGLGVAPELADVARNVMVEQCPNISDAELGDIHVSKITKPAKVRDGIDASLIYRGQSKNIHFNMFFNHANCEPLNGRVFPSPYLEEYRISHERIEMVKYGEAADILVKLEGFSEPIVAIMIAVSDLSTGKILMNLPKKGNCTGDYHASKSTEGTWDLICTNGLKAKGTYTAIGYNKDVIGTGVDTQGHSVTFTQKEGA